MENGRNRQYLNFPAMQERPVTLGEILFRNGLIDRPDPPPRPMGRTMSPTRCLGPLANGRPRRARGRMITRPSTSATANDENIQGEPQEPQQPQEPRQSQRRRRNIQRPGVLPDSLREQRAEARIRNFFSLTNSQRRSRRRGNTSAGRFSRSDSPDQVTSSYFWQTRNLTRRRTSIITGSRTNMPVPRRSLRVRTPWWRTLEDRPRGTRVAAYRPRYNRSYTSTITEAASTDATNTEDSENTADVAGTSGSEIGPNMRRFINFSAEFIPVVEHPPDAEPPEWSLNITAADFGPFAIGRSALSRARSLAIMGVLSQVDDSETGAAGNEHGNSNEN